MRNQKNVLIDPKPSRLWLKILIGLSLPIVLIIVAILALQIWDNGFGVGRRCKHEIGFWGKLWCGISETY